MKLDKKRKLQRKTNYSKRLKLLKQGYLRLVIRKTNKYLILQIIKSNHAKDFVLYSVNSKELIKLGWPKEKSLKNITCAYLSGYLLGNKAKEIKEKIILDMGLHPNTKGSKIYACVKGLLDSGIDININEKVIHSEDRIQGKHLKEDSSSLFNKIKENIK